MITLTLLFFLLSFLCYRFVFYSSPRKRTETLTPPPEVQSEENRHTMSALIEELTAIPYETVCINSYDGTRLCGLYYHVRDGAPLHIQFHGYVGFPRRDLCGGSKLAREAEHNYLLVYQRAHGKSGGKTITFGVKERKDCLAWLDYVIKRFGENTPIYLVGVSMGASTVLMAAEFPLPTAVKAIVADSPFTTPDAIIQKVCKDMRVPRFLAMPALRTGARLFGKFSTRGASCLSAISKTTVPVLLLHGENDGFVPCDMSRELYAARGQADVTLVTFPQADHALSYIVAPKEYTKAVNEFLHRL
ncbi:MAG: alpha/beta hydrolase [Clostridia bacterium]|nr:alpha/beta hydrolase [Clostridia bacterium]